MATKTVLDLITASLKRLGAISGIETPSADLAQDGLDRLNELVETWRTESLSVFNLGSEVTPLVVGQSAYTMGPTGDMPFRPAVVQGVNLVFRVTPVYEVPLTRLDDDEWRVLRMKFLQSGQPTHYYYLSSYPTAQLALWPIFSGAGSVVDVAVYGLIPTYMFPALSTVLDMPPGYYRALRDNLALELAPEVGRPIDPALAQSAIEAKAQVQRANFRPHVLAMPIGLATGDRSGYDWRTD